MWPDHVLNLGPLAPDQTRCQLCYAARLSGSMNSGLDQGNLTGLCTCVIKHSFGTIKGREARTLKLFLHYDTI